MDRASSLALRATSTGDILVCIYPIQSGRGSGLCNATCCPELVHDGKNLEKTKRCSVQRQEDNSKHHCEMLTRIQHAVNIG